MAEKRPSDLTCSPHMRIFSSGLSSASGVRVPQHTSRPASNKEQTQLNNAGDFTVGKSVTPASAWNMAHQGQENNTKCEHDGCIASFKDAKSLKRHEREEHEYCEYHNQGFADWDALLQHKIEHPEHIVCPTCGEDFKSVGGRDRHLLIRHPRIQNCECPGCENIYTRASSLMNHIESNLCQNITWAQFMKIHMKNSLLAGHVEGLEDGSGAPGAKKGPDVEDEAEFPSLSGRSKISTPGSKETGSVPLEMETEGSMKNTLASKAELEHLIGHCTQKMSTGNSKQSVSNDDKEEENYLLDRENTEHVPIKPMLPLANLPQDKPARMRRLGRIMWGENALKRINDIIEPKDTPDRLNPFSAKFHVEAFKNHNKYCCPKPKCSKRFDKPGELTAHLQSPAHNPWTAVCPQCFSQFKGAAALVSHMEAPSFRCRIKESEYFRDALEVATSGFVTHERRGHEHIFKGNEPGLS